MAISGMMFSQNVCQNGVNQMATNQTCKIHKNIELTKNLHPKATIGCLAGLICKGVGY